MRLAEKNALIDDEDVKGYEVVLQAYATDEDRYATTYAKVVRHIASDRYYRLTWVDYHRQFVGDLKLRCVEVRPEQYTATRYVRGKNPEAVKPK